MNNMRKMMTNSIKFKDQTKQKKERVYYIVKCWNQYITYNGLGPKGKAKRYQLFKTALQDSIRLPMSQVEKHKREGVRYV